MKPRPQRVEAARLAKAHEPELDDLDLPDMLHDDEEIRSFRRRSQVAWAKPPLSARELAALDDDDDDDSLIGDLDDEGDAPRGRGRKAKGAEPPDGSGSSCTASKFADAGDDDDDDADDDFDSDRPSNKSKSSPDGKRRVGRPPGKRTPKPMLKKNQPKQQVRARLPLRRGLIRRRAEDKKPTNRKPNPRGKAAKADKSAGKAKPGCEKQTTAKVRIGRQAGQRARPMARVRNKSGRQVGSKRPKMRRTVTRPKKTPKSSRSAPEPANQYRSKQRERTEDQNP